MEEIVPGRWEGPPSQPSQLHRSFVSEKKVTFFPQVLTYVVAHAMIALIALTELTRLGEPKEKSWLG